MSGRFSRALSAAGLAAMVLSLGPAPASALIHPGITVDGPASTILAFGGVAMAEDGSGGAVYLKRINGSAHVFVARYVNGRWQAPIQADIGSAYAASWPRIGAASGGRLVVVWATPFATVKGRQIKELMSATLGLGATMFAAPQIIDGDIEEGNGANPNLAMSSTGQADLVYRVVEQQTAGTAAASVSLLRSGDVVEEVRVAHYNGERWAALGEINRNTGISMRAPSPYNAPRVAIGPTGSGLVVWQEPDIEGVARIWARRLFGASIDYVLPVSATSFNGAGIGIDADAPSVSISRFGQAVVAYRQPTGAGSPLSGPRIFLNTLPDGESVNGAEFIGAKVVDESVSGGSGATVGLPSVDIDDKREVRLLYDSNGTPRVIAGDDKGALSSGLSLGPDFHGFELSSVSVMNPSGGGISAWPSADSNGLPALAVREDFPQGGAQTALVSGPVGGAIYELGVARSGLGDGIVGFRKGAVGYAAIVVAAVSAPPEQFTVSVPVAWVRPREAIVRWQPAPSTRSPLRYQVVLDGRLQQTPAGVLQLTLDRRRLSDGVHLVQVLATDADNQAVLTPPQTLRLDTQAPTVTVLASGSSSATVRVSDTSSGVEAQSVRVSFGDGSHGEGRTLYRHRYASPGIFELDVRARDHAGNDASIHRLVSVP